MTASVHPLFWQGCMVAHCMRAHNPWLHMACQRVEETFLASFHKVSRMFFKDYDRKMRD